jgi:hypothetical protein
MDDVGLDPAGLQPTREPEPVASRLKGECDALDRASGFIGFLPPALQKL